MTVNNVIITVGFTGSGKSTWARQYVKNHPTTAIVSPDGFRSMFNGEYKYVPIQDDVITESTFDTAKNLLANGYDVIIDCGNLTNSIDRRSRWLRLPAAKFYAVVMPMDKPVGWYVERRMQNPHWPVNVKQIVENEMKAYQPIGRDEPYIIIHGKDSYVEHPDSDSQSH